MTPLSKVLTKTKEYVPEPETRQSDIHTAQDNDSIPGDGNGGDSTDLSDYELLSEYADDADGYNGESGRESHALQTVAAERGVSERDSTEQRGGGLRGLFKRMRKQRTATDDAEVS